MEFLQEIFLKVFNMGITGSIMILAVLAIRALLCKAPRRYSYLLWGVVLFRLLCPISLPSVFSVFNLADAQVSGSGGLEYVSPESVRGEAANMAAYAQTEENKTQAFLAQNLKEPGDSFPAQKESRILCGIPLPVWVCVWFLGISVLAGYSFFSAIKLRQTLRCAMRLRDNIYLADPISMPFVFGFFCPRIYLPSSLAASEREYVIFHERCHIRRKDYLAKAAAFLALCLHWPNPLVWLAFVLAGRDMEMSCDEAVMLAMDHDIRAEYAESLLKLAVGKKRMAGMHLAFGEGDVKSRIKHVMRYKKQTAFAAAFAAVICVVGMACLATNPAPGTSEEDPEAVSETETGQSLSESETEEDLPVLEDADSAIQNAIMEHNKGHYAYSDECDFACCSFASLMSGMPAASGGEQTVTYYGWAFYAEYMFSENGIEDVGGSHIPVALTFSVGKDGYQLREYWEPRDGKYLAPDVKDKFPAQIAEDGIDSQKSILQQIQECYAQAVEYGDLDTDTILEHLLDVICESPAESSNPQDYISMHDTEYRELLYYGDYAVEYFSQCFAAGDETGLRGHIMARACEELLGTKGKLSVDAESAVTGQEWHDAWRAYAGEGIEGDEKANLTKLGIPVALPSNTSWIQNANIIHEDEDCLQIEYYDGILGGKCVLQAVKDGDIDIPGAEPGKQADETWEGNTKSGQLVTIHVFLLEKQVAAVWEYKNCKFAIIGNLPLEQTDISPVPKTAIYVIEGLE